MFQSRSIREKYKNHISGYPSVFGCYTPIDFVCWINTQKTDKYGWNGNRNGNEIEMKKEKE